MKDVYKRQEYNLAYSTYNKADDPLGLTVGDICRQERRIMICMAGAEIPF